MSPHKEPECRGWTRWQAIVTRLRDWIGIQLGGKPRDRLELGWQGEQIAERHLVRLGYRILGRRDRGRWGEIDLIAVDGRTVVFVEVKTRSSWQNERLDEVIGAEKQRRITHQALTFLKRYRLLNCPARFDVIAVTWTGGDAAPVIEHLLNAFPSVDSGQMFS